MYGGSGEWDERIGPLIEVGLFAGGFSEAADIPRFKALIDTGAETTCVSRTAAAVLDIRDRPVRTQAVRSPSGRADLNVYQVNLVFFVTPSVLQVQELEVIETKADSDAWDVLIGRDVLKNAIFTTDFAGHFAIAVR